MFLFLGYLFVKLTYFNQVIVDYIFSNLALKNQFLKDIFKTSDDENLNITKETIMENFKKGVIENKVLTINSAPSKI